VETNNVNDQATLEAMGPKLADFDKSLHELLTAVHEACETAWHVDEEASALPAHKRNEAYRLRRHLALFAHKSNKRREARRSPGAY
jgi:hypothetical protein